MDSAERELFPHSTRQAFCFAAYCQCAAQIKEHLRALLRDLSIQSTGELCAVSSLRVRRLATRDNICTKCKPEAPAADTSANRVSKGLHFAEGNFVCSHKNSEVI